MTPQKYYKLPKNEEAVKNSFKKISQKTQTHPFSRVKVQTSEVNAVF